MNGSNVSEPAGNGHSLARWRWWRLAASILAGVAALLLPLYLARAGLAWRTNVRVDDAPGSAWAYWPSVAVDPAGNAYAVWCDERNGNRDIYFSYRPAGGNWQGSVRVDDAPGSTDAYVPAIAVDPSGNAYAVWADDRNGHHYDIYFSYRPLTGTWQANQRIDDAPGSTPVFYPSIAVDPSGNAYAVWTDYRNGNWDIYYSNTYTPTVYLPVVLKSFIYYSNTYTPTVYLPVVLKNFFCDQYEPNDRRPISGGTPWGPLASGQTIHAEICPGDPRDLYYFDASGAVPVTIDLTGMAGSTNCDLYLWNEAGNTPLAKSEKGAGQNEHIAYTLPGAGHYYVDVYPWSGSGPYTLQGSGW